LNVCILEKAAIPRYKTCGGGISGRAMNLIGESFSSVVERACLTAQFALSPGMTFTAARNEPIILMTMRDAFDRWLVTRARAAGAKLRDNCAVQQIAMERDQIRLTTSRGEVLAKFVVAADGASSLIARKCNWPASRCVAAALECEVVVAPADFARFVDATRFDFHVVPRGYAWVFPKNAHLSIGVLTLNPALVNLNRCVDKYLNDLGIANPISIERHGYVIPLAPRDRVLARSNVFLVGDSAGLADPITAEGIANAILSGQLAGQAIANAFAYPDLGLAAYNAAVESQIFPELRWARRLAKLLYAMPRARDALFKWQGQRLTEIMTDVVIGKVNYSSLMKSPANYLKLFMGA
jgi:geranylgeranyl reductase family protein